MSRSSHTAMGTRPLPARRPPEAEYEESCGLSLTANSFCSDARTPSLAACVRQESQCSSQGNVSRAPSFLGAFEMFGVHLSAPPTPTTRSPLAPKFEDPKPCRSPKEELARLAHACGPATRRPSACRRCGAAPDPAVFPETYADLLGLLLPSSTPPVAPGVRSDATRLSDPPDVADGSLPIPELLALRNAIVATRTLGFKQLQLCSAEKDKVIEELRTDLAEARAEAQRLQDSVLQLRADGEELEATVAMWAARHSVFSEASNRRASELREVVKEFYTATKQVQALERTVSERERQIDVLQKNHRDLEDLAESRGKQIQRLTGYLRITLQAQADMVKGGQQRRAPTPGPGELADRVDQWLWIDASSSAPEDGVLPQDPPRVAVARRRRWRRPRTVGGRFLTRHARALYQVQRLQAGWAERGNNGEISCEDAL